MSIRRLALLRVLPWIAAASCCVAAICIRNFLIQPADVAQRCDLGTLAFTTLGPWWCNVRTAAVMTYAWGGLTDAAIGLSIVTLLWRRAWLAATTLAVGLVAIVWYSYEPGAVAITIGALVLVRPRARERLRLRPAD